jgi:hypothetical protein
MSQCPAAHQMTCADCPGPGLPFLLWSGAFYPIAQTPAQASNPLTDPGLRALSRLERGRYEARSSARSPRFVCPEQGEYEAGATFTVRHGDFCHLTPPWRASQRPTKG